ncbi:MAG: MlaD family protein [Candidatus Eisenbacteria bacterium]|nr:MlaD family protein [Candidatus Eisenbacteria bacterium]
MSKKNTELKVGITALIALLILSISIIWIKQLKPGRKTYLIQTEFPDVSGLSKGDPVTVNGVAKGVVRSIKLSDGTVKVLLAVEQDVVLREDAAVLIKSSGLMGEKEVSIYAGMSEKALDLSKTLKGTYGGDLVDVMAKLGNVLSSIEVVASTLGSASDTTRKMQSFKQGIGDIFAFAEESRKLIEENREDLRKAVTDFKASGEELRKVLATNSPRIGTTIQGFETSSKKLERAIVRFDSLSAKLGEVAQKTNEGKGTMSKLINDPALYDDLRKTAQDASALIADIKANPSKYFKVKVF